jgi:opacity protein-like surface antigen
LIGLDAFFHNSIFLYDCQYHSDLLAKKSILGDCEELITKATWREIMLSLFSKGYLATLFALLSLSAMNSSLTAWECCEQPSCNRLYIGAFGGGIWSDKNRVTQYGTAFFPEPPDSIGPLSIIGEGHLKKTSTGFGGAQVGYEWSRPVCSDWVLATAGELEVFFFKHKKKGHLINQTVRGLDEHDFADSFHMNSSVILANVVLSINNDCLCGISPYVGGGIGAARVSLHKADSLQVEPPEAGVNHFNSNRNDSSWAFAAQAKIGVRYNFCQMFHIFAEYRYLYVDAANYIFGATNYPNHVPTSAWNVKVKNMNYNAFALGIQFDL